MLTKILIISFILFSQTSFVQAQNFEKLGDKFYSMRNIFKNGKPDIGIIEKAIQNYQKVLEQDPSNDKIIFKYIKAVDFKYGYFIQSKDEKKKIYKNLTEMLEKNYSDNKKSPYLNYCLTLIWGRYGELLSILKAARSGIAGKVKKYADNLYGIDKKFENYFASLVLGRLHYKTPKIPLILTWPDLKKSRKYLEEVVKNYPDSLYGKYYLADTLYRLDEIEKAKKYYIEVKTAVPRKERLLEDLKIQKECTERMEVLGIK